MPNHPLAAYLNDHLAGSIAGIDLAASLAKAASRANDQDRAMWLESLRDDLAAAQAVLRAVMTRNHASEAMLTQAGAWMTERLTRAKLALTSATDGAALAWLDGLEALALGLQGQAALWRALDVSLPSRDPRRANADFAALERRALILFAQVDRARLAAAATALT